LDPLATIANNEDPPELTGLHEGIIGSTQNDMVVLCYGTKDFDQENMEKNYACTFENIKKFIMSNKQTNIPVINIPSLYDVINTDYANQIIARLNRKLQKLVKINPHRTFLVTSHDSKLFTKYGLHYNKQGKYLFNLQIASSLLSFAPNTKESITLDWYHSGIEKQNKAVTSEVKVPNRNSCRNRKVPITRTNDFLWPA